MKILALIISLFSISLSQAQEETQNYSISVTVPNVYQEGGVVVFSLHTKDTFMKKPFQVISSKIDNKTATATFTDIPIGTYAVLVLHDKNENNKMDFNANGMPAEAYGISNNVMTMGPPRFEDAKFNLNEDLEFEVKF